MVGVQNFLQLLSDNWISILVCIGLIIGMVERTIIYFSKSKEERIDIAKSQVSQTILKMISDAENDWDSWNSSGSIKRSQVIAQIYEKYPVLSKVQNQDELTKWIDAEINKSLKTLREIVKDNKIANID